MDSGLGLGWLRERALAKRRVCLGLLDGLRGLGVFSFSLNASVPRGLRARAQPPPGVNANRKVFIEVRG